MTDFPKVRRSLPSRRRCILAIIGLAMLGTMPACYGRFAVTHAIHRWNGRVTGNGFVNSIIMIVLWIIPVYQIAIIVDAFLVNTIEFWSGDDVEVAKVYDQPDGSTIVFGPGAAKNEAVMELFKDGALIATRHFVRDSTGVTTISDESGTVLSRVTPDGANGFVFTNASNERTGQLTAAEISELRRQSAGEAMRAGAALPASGG